MSESSVVCKELSQDEYLKMIENNPVLQEKLDKIGISDSEDGLAVRLNYSDLLTAEEKKCLREGLSAFFKEGLFAKFGKNDDEHSICITDKICDRCYANLLNRRERLQSE